MWMKGSILISICMLIMASCASRRQAARAPVASPIPVNTSIPFLIRVTPAPEFIDIGSGGFSLSIQPGPEFEAHAASISISDQNGELIISLNGRPYVASSYTIKSFLGKYLAEKASRGGSFDQGEPYDVVIDGSNGVAIDFSGSFLENPIKGKAVAVSPGEEFMVLGLGMPLLNQHENGWAESGSLIFEAILDSINFKQEVK